MVVRNLKPLNLVSRIFTFVFDLFQVVGYGKYELEEDGTPSGEDSNSSCEVMQLTYLPTSPLLADCIIPITDIRAFTSTLNLLPYHKIVK